MTLPQKSIHIKLKATYRMALIVRFHVNVYMQLGSCLNLFVQSGKGGHVIQDQPFRVSDLNRESLFLCRRGTITELWLSS